MDKPVVRISVRNLVEFILRSGDLDNRGGSSDREAMQKGSRLHRKIQGRMGSHYRAEVSLKYKTEYEDVSIQVEGRADGIFTEDGQCWIDEIKGLCRCQSVGKACGGSPCTGNVLCLDLRTGAKTGEDRSADDIWESGHRGA